MAHLVKNNRKITERHREACVYALLRHWRRADDRYEQEKRRGSRGRQTRRVLPNVNFKGLAVDLERSTINDEDGDGISELDRRIHALPQELFDEIRDLTLFTCSSGTVEIDEDYQPPALLSVCKESRKKFAPLYYGRNATFVFRSKYTLFQWLYSLSKDHRRSIGHVHYLHKYPAVRRQVTEDEQLGVIASKLADVGIKLEAGVLRVTVEAVEYESLGEIMETYRADEGKWNKWMQNTREIIRPAMKLEEYFKGLHQHP
ncbi:hypothetical protein LTR37_003375 [Vermiconidia calcicola]|uniref:Uncharacterized protein n=1 Tax=Vermiconidia calcicola TaxID=1690605 RepID=A0ACC3NR47_9PEZI|nr:hypothetical protein LTR37_003375 [Vermiconidia calcicola]